MLNGNGIALQHGFWLLTLNSQLLTSLTPHLSLTQATRRGYHRLGAAPGWDAAFPSLRSVRDWKSPGIIPGSRAGPRGGRKMFSDNENPGAEVPAGKTATAATPAPETINLNGQTEETLP